MMFDVDHFKKINDTHGHPLGDSVLKEISQRLSANLRETDILCRYGGRSSRPSCQTAGSRRLPKSPSESGAPSRTRL